MAAGDGLISMTPTSIVAGVGTASINADGGVDFSAVTSLSLNGVFTGDYDNYLIVYRATISTGSERIDGVLRSNGTDANGTDYTVQVFVTNDTTISGSRVTSSSDFYIAGADATLVSGADLHMYGPYLAQPTAMRSVGVFGQNGARTYDFASTHSLSTSYDGMTILPSSNSITGTVHVFGYEE